MNILIRGMEMPIRCYTCPCADLEFYDCNLMPGRRIEQYKRLDDCPLVPVPAHGRLIDADALLQLHSVSDGIYFPDAYIPATAIKAAPTIIPAEPCNNLSKPCKKEGE